MKNWLKHLFCHEWVMELEYLTPRNYGDECWITYNRLMVCKRCGKLKHYTTKIAACGRMPLTQCKKYMESIKEQMKEQGFFKTYEDRRTTQNH